MGIGFGGANMYRATLYVAIALMTTSLIPLAAEPIEIAKELSLLTDEGANAFNEEYQFLLPYNSDLQKTPDESAFSKLIEMACSSDSLEGFLFDAFMRSTKNRRVAAFYSDYINSHGMHQQQVQQIQAILEARDQTDTDEANSVVTKEGIFEGIDMFTMGAIDAFAGKLRVTLFSNNTIIETDDHTGFLFPGNTNSILIVLKEYQTDKSQFLNDIVNSKDDYENWQILSLNDAAILKNYHADGLWIGIGAKESRDSFIEEKVNFYLYSDKYKEGFAISWYMNMNSHSIFFNNPDRVLLHVADMAISGSGILVKDQ
jgi:hypothetical protein